MQIRIRLATLAAAALGLSEWGHAAAPIYSIDAHVVASGARATAANSCFRLQATIGEPVAGYSASAGFSLSAGFWLLVRDAGDVIYSSGFEDCPS